MEDYVANNARAYRPRYFTGLECMHIGGVKGEVRILENDSKQGVVLLTPMELAERGNQFF